MNKNGFVEINVKNCKNLFIHEPKNVSHTIRLVLLLSIELKLKVKFITIIQVNFFKLKQKIYI